MACTLLESDVEIGGVLVVHLYGQIIEFYKLYEKAKSLGILLVEDVAQAQGGKYNNAQPAGSLGDFSIFSFGHTKILDCGGGGALLTNDRSLFTKARANAIELHPKIENADLQYANFKELYYRIWDENRKDARNLIKISDLGNQYRSLFLHAADIKIVSYLYKKMPRLNGIVKKRLENYNEYRAQLAGCDKIQIVEMSDNSVPWRFVFLVKSCVRDELMHFLRKRSVDVSSWYPPLFVFVKNNMPINKLCPKSQEFASCVVNLWVGPNLDREKVIKNCDNVLEFFEQKPYIV